MKILKSEIKNELSRLASASARVCVEKKDLHVTGVLVNHEGIYYHVSTRDGDANIIFSSKDVKKIESSYILTITLKEK